jgi:hypothetical protein
MRPVNVKPMSVFMRTLSPKWWHCTPPIFPYEIYGEVKPTAEEKALARALFQELDEISQQWYRRGRPELFAGL